MTDDTEEVEYSDYCGEFSRDGVTVHVDIYRLSGADGGWILEVIDVDDNSLIWEDPFPTDEDAWNEFLRAVEEDGIEQLIGPPPDELH